MILDAIIFFIVSVCGLLAGCVLSVAVPVINLLAAAIELLVGIFVSGFSLGRLQKPRRKQQSQASVVIGAVTLLLVAGTIGWLVIYPKVMTRNIALVAEDGHSLPYAAVIIHKGEKAFHRRSDSAGNIRVSRFGTSSITVKDPRYVERTWDMSEIESEIKVGRTVLGSSLDTFADQLLKPAKDRK